MFSLIHWRSGSWLFSFYEPKQFFFRVLFLGYHVRTSPNICKWNILKPARHREVRLNKFDICFFCHSHYIQLIRNELMIKLVCENSTHLYRFSLLCKVGKSILHSDCQTFLLITTFLKFSGASDSFVLWKLPLSSSISFLLHELDYFCLWGLCMLL